MGAIYTGINLPTPLHKIIERKKMLMCHGIFVNFQAILLNGKGQKVTMLFLHVSSIYEYLYRYLDFLLLSRWSVPIKYFYRTSKWWPRPWLLQENQGVKIIIFGMHDLAWPKMVPLSSQARRGCTGIST